MKAAVPTLLLLAACTAAPPLVTLTGTPAAPRYAVSGDGPAAAEVRRQLVAKGLYAADAATIIRAGYGVAPRRTSACLEADPAAKSGCKAWHDAPAGWSPLAPPLRHHLVLVIDGASSARIDVTRPGGKSGDRAVALAPLVSAALARLPATAG